MHVRFSTVIGMPVTEERTEEHVAALSGILIHPDQGKIEGFFVRIPSFLQSDERFLSTTDIMHWGNRIRIRNAEMLSPLEDLLRLQQLSDEPRPVIGQKIVTENGAYVGMCKDVQFDTRVFMLEWLFPRKFFRWGIAIPASSIVQVRPDAIVVRDSVTLPEVVKKPSVLQTLDPLGSTTAPRVAQYKKSRG
jgi:sporulation protein YlmC with PRC-barrel domain